MNSDETIVAPITSIHSEKRFACRISGSLVHKMRRTWLGDSKPMQYEAQVEELDIGLAVPLKILSLTMPKGCSYTKEDVWEIHFDANEAILSKVLAKCYREGVRPAEPGEFTRRAYLNGRVDLSQAQAIAALVQAKSLQHRTQALKMMSGDKGDLLRQLRLKLLSMRAHLEAVIDFPEEPDAFESRNMWRREWEELRLQMELCHQQMNAQLNIESNMRVLVIGAANAGKSSFLKVMVPSSQPIISTQAGTTLDLVPYECELAEHKLLLYDSPGLKHKDGLLDELSLGQLKQRVQSFDAYLLLENEEEDFSKKLNLPKDRPTLRLLAKADLMKERSTKRLPWSALTLEGYQDVCQQLKSFLDKFQREEQSPWWSLRIQILKQGESSLSALHDLLCEADSQEELAAYEIDEWLDMWDGILAEEKDNDTLLDMVFREFCIGK